MFYWNRKSCPFSSISIQFILTYYFHFDLHRFLTFLFAFTFIEFKDLPRKFMRFFFFESEESGLMVLLAFLRARKKGKKTYKMFDWLIEMDSKLNVIHLRKEFSTWKSSISNGEGFFITILRFPFVKLKKLQPPILKFHFINKIGRILLSFLFSFLV